MTRPRCWSGCAWRWSPLLGAWKSPPASRLYREGLSHLIDQPEFRETDRLKQMLDLLEGDSILLSIVPAVQARAKACR